MKRFINYWRYTKSIGFMFRLIIAGLFTKMGSLFQNNKFGEFLLKISNKFCTREQIFNTPFGKYLGKSLNEYILMDYNYEPEIGEIIKKMRINKENEKYLINIGANIGRWAIDIGKNYGYKVIAIEPAPSTYNKLRVNIALSNQLDNIETYNIALGDENTELDFEYMEYHNGSSHIITDNTKLEGGEIIKVPVKRFDDLQIDNRIIKETRLIIMDVEGFELNVIKGMKKTLSEFKDISIIMEIRENKKNKEDTINLMKELGYSVKKIDDSDYLFSKQ